MNDNNLINVAAGKGRTVWLQNLLREFLPQLNYCFTKLEMSDKIRKNKTKQTD